MLREYDVVALPIEAAEVTRGAAVLVTTGDLTDGFRLADAGLQIERHASIFWIRKSSPVPVRSLATLPGAQSAWYATFFNAALKRGVYLPPAAFEVCFVSMAHDDRVLAKAADALVAAAEEVDGGRVFRPGEGNQP